MPKFQWQETRDKNPFVLSRKALGMTQKDLAEVSHVTEQYIYRQENGLVNTPSPSYILWLCERLSEHGHLTADYTYLDFTEDYNSWVLEMREHVARALGDRSDTLLYGPRLDVNNLREEHPFITFMFNLTEYCARKFGLLYPEFGLDTRSQQLFARMICVHPRAIQSYTAPRASAEYPPVLRQALIESGISTATLETLKREVAFYSVRVWPV